METMYLTLRKHKYSTVKICFITISCAPSSKLNINALTTARSQVRLDNISAANINLAIHRVHI